MIQIENLSKSYQIGKKDIPVLHEVSFNIDEGEMVALTGKSGSGKSTLLNIIGILDKYDSGNYFFNNNLIKDITETQAAIYRNKYIGFVFQSFHLIPGKTALDNVGLPLYYRGVGNKIRRKKSMEVLEKVGLADRHSHYPNELSGGQKQRVAIARALITEPGLILADEPTGALDSNTSREIMDLFKSIHAEGSTLLIVTHEAEIAKQCERIINIQDGKII